MEIVDVNAWTGHWGTYTVPGTVDAVRRQLLDVGVTRICLAPLEAVWAHNPHHRNTTVYQAAARFADITPVPVLDPTIASWPEELHRARQAGVRLVKLVPAYSRYDLGTAEPLLDALEEACLTVLVQLRLEDPRCHHPMACVEDFPAADVARMAQRRPRLTVIIGGATTANLVALKAPLRDLPSLYADISQADGMDAVRRLVDAGLHTRLLFGTHAPLFEPLAGLARVLPELDDQTAAAVLGRNASAVLDRNGGDGAGRR